MLVPIPHFQWQVLRAVLRAEAAGAPALGKDLRLVPSRKTKDGTFLDEMVREGFLTPVGKPEPLPAGSDVPAPFRVRYRLTPLGKTAAEYGEYDRPFTPTVVVEAVAEKSKSAVAGTNAKVGRRKAAKA